MIFVDSSFWIALRFARDSRHPEAVRLFETHEARSLLTTNHVVGETWTFLRRRMGHRSAINFLDSVDRSARVDVVGVSGPQERQAWRWLRRHDERSYSFVDATSFAVMDESEIREALAFDGDFDAAGFVELRI